MVGGEQANNEEVKERRKRKKKHAEERRKKLLGEHVCLNPLLYYYASAPNRRDIKRCFCLTSDVCLSVAYIGPKSRTERPRKTKIGTGIAHVTQWLGHHFQGQKVKGQGHQAALLNAALTHKAAAAVSVGTYSTW